MKTGLITIHAAYNSGAMLQAYATQKAINKIGHECEIIDYYPKELEKINKRQNYQIFSIRTLLKKLFITFNTKTKRRIKNYESFRSLMNLSERIYTKESLNSIPNYDIYITGSDQVWNCQTTVNHMFFLNFVPKESKKISYASSFGTKTIPDIYKNKLSEYLKEYQYLSTREYDGVNIIKDLINKDANLVLDPTFLLDSSEWKSVEKKVNLDKRFDNGYILYYGSFENDNTENVLKELTDKFNLPVIITCQGLKCPMKADKIIYDFGPSEFIYLIRNSKLVISNSFHSTVFAIIFKVPFYIIPHKTRNSRMESLVKMLKIDNRFIYGVNIDNVLLSLNYTEITNTLESHIEHSKSYLKNSVEQLNNI